MEFLILLGAVLLIVLAVAVAKEFWRIALMKGNPEKRYFWWSLFLGIVGWLMVIALPDRGGAVTEKPVAEDEIPDI